MTKTVRKFDTESQDYIDTVFEETGITGEYMEVNALARKPVSMILTIAEGANISNVVNVKNESFFVLAIPAAAGLNANSLIQPEFSDADDGTFLPLTSDGSPLTPFRITPHASIAMLCPIDPNGYHMACHFMRLHVVNSANENVNQTAAREFLLMGKG